MQSNCMGLRRINEKSPDLLRSQDLAKTNMKQLHQSIPFKLWVCQLLHDIYLNITYVSVSD